MKIHPDILKRYDDMCSRHESRISNDFDEENYGELVAGTSLRHLRWMLREIPTLEETDSHKAHRWIAFVQTVLIMSGFTSVMKERDFTRPYFASASFKINDNPATGIEDSLTDDAISEENRLRDIIRERYVEDK